MPNLTIAQIEDALLAAIRADSDLKLVANGGYTKLIDSYAGQFEQAKDEIILLYPCVLVLFVKAAYDTNANRSADCRLTFDVLVADQNLRGSKGAARGSAGSVGTYRMMEDVRDLLQGNRLGLDALDPLHLTQQSLVAYTPDISVYALEFECGMVVRNI